MFYRMLSKLLDYPDAGLLGVTWEVRERCRHTTEMSEAECRTMAGFVDFLESRPLTDLQAAYVQTFDLTPEHALHLTHHLFGDDNNRGPALIDLTEFYKQYGLEMANDIASNELPDFLPLMLEFCDGLSLDEARMFLSQWGKTLNQLAANLEEAESPYAPLIRLVEQRGRLVRAAA